MIRLPAERSLPAVSAPVALADGDTPDREQVRLELKPDVTHTGYVDGGWWPRSRDLRAELPGLLEALASRLGSAFGPVLRIGFGLGEWGPQGRGRLVTATGGVAFGGFTHFESDVVWLSGHSSAHTPIVLLVVPPATPTERARAAMLRAAAAGNAERPTELLHDHGDPADRDDPSPTAPLRGIDIGPTGA